MSRYHKQVEVRWSDIDANQHMRHSAYADLCTHTRTDLFHSFRRDGAHSGRQASCIWIAGA